MEKSVIQKIILGAIFGAFIGFGIAWVYFTDRMPGFNEEVEEVVDRKTDENTDQTNDVETGSEKLPSSYSDFPELLSVKSQSYGDVVKIEKAVFDTLGWVVVYEDTDGEPGNILGAGLFRKENGEVGEVPLLRATEQFKKYYVVLHEDDGDGCITHFYIHRSAEGY